MGHRGVPELCRDVWVPQEPMENEYRQTQNVAVALQRDELPEDCLRMSRMREIAKELTGTTEKITIN